MLKYNNILPNKFKNKRYFRKYSVILWFETWNHVGKAFINHQKKE